MIGVSQISVAAYRGGGAAAPVNLDFISTWDTTQAGSASDTVVLPLLSGGTYSGTIDWGDGNSDALSYANRTHVYASSGIYTITIYGTIGGFRFANSGDKLKILNVSNWGTFDIANDRTFDNCGNLTITATDVPTITTTSLYTTFRNCDSLTNEDFSKWDTSTVTDMREVFSSSDSFNGDVSNWVHSGVTTLKGFFIGTGFNNNSISSWDTSGVQDMKDLFKQTPFNQDLSSWDVSSVTAFGTIVDGMFDSSSFNNSSINSWGINNTSSVTMAGMFRNTPFNQDISGWDVSSVTNMRNMFQSNISFNQPIGIWDVSSVTLMNDMFFNSDSFNQDISAWQISQATNLNNLMTNATGLSTANYDALLIAWDAQGAMSYSGTVNFGGSKYTAGGAAEAARTSLISKWGGIIDGGAA
jgi:surface protein